MGESPSTITNRNGASEEDAILGHDICDELVHVYAKRGSTVAFCTFERRKDRVHIVISSPAAERRKIRKNSETVWLRIIGYSNIVVFRGSAGTLI